MSSSSQFVAVLRRWIDIFMRRSMHSFILFSKQSGLSMSQIGALFQIYHRGIRGVSDIGDNLGITSAAASQMLERLVQQDLVVRSEDPQDRRVKKIVITEKGLHVLEESTQARQGWLDDLAKRLTSQEQEQVMASLNILIDVTSQLDKEAEPQR